MDLSTVGNERSIDETGVSSEGAEEFGVGKGVPQQDDATMGCDVRQSATHNLDSMIISIREAECSQNSREKSPVKQP